VVLSDLVFEGIVEHKEQMMGKVWQQRGILVLVERNTFIFN
jgi:hypothetical protein